MRNGFVILALIVPAAALALPDDAALTQLLAGTWHGHRHDTEYRSDGSWIMDPPDEGDNNAREMADRAWPVNRDLAIHR